MLAIIPDYEESSSDEDQKTSASHGINPSQGQIGQQEFKRSSDNLINPSGSVPDDDLLKRTTQESLVIKRSMSKSNENYISDLPECKDEAKGSFNAASGSDGDCKNLPNKLSSEQKSVLRYLALKRRRDEEMKQLEMVEDTPDFKRGKRRRKKRKGTDETNYRPATGSSVSGSTSEMQTLTSYIGVNDHLRGSLVDHGDLAPKSGLEKQIDHAISEGDMNKAEELSDYLAKRNFAVRVAEAANARDYHRCKQEEEKEKLAKKKLKKSKLAWGFEVKHRWEMKGNM